MVVGKGVVRPGGGVSAADDWELEEFSWVVYLGKDVTAVGAVGSLRTPCSNEILLSVLYLAPYKAIFRGSRLVDRESLDVELRSKNEDTRHRFIQIQIVKIA